MNDLMQLDPGDSEKLRRDLAVMDSHNIKRMPLPDNQSLDLLAAEIGALMRMPDISRAAEQAEILLGSYPRANIDEPKIYSRAIVSMLMRYPVVVGSRAVDQLTSIKRFPPSRADVKDACDEQFLKINKVKAAIILAKTERQRRADDAARSEEVRKSKQEFKEKHGDKSPLDVLRDKGLYKGLVDEKEDIK